MTERILVVEDNKDMQFLLSSILTSEGYETIVAGDGAKALQEARKRLPDVVLLDIRLPGMNGMAVLEELKRTNKDVAVCMLTAYGDIKGAVQAMKLGAFEYITKPFDNEELLIVVKRALRTRCLNKEVESLRKQLGEKTSTDLISQLVGESPAIKQVLKQVDVVAPTNMTVVLQGESGTGKELIAQLIHRKSARRDGAFVAIDCGAIPESLVESELFGYEKGAFTGADAHKKGKFEQADGGAIFLDEITNLPGPAQGKFLRVLQEKRLQHLGGKKDIKVDVRIIAASNIDLPEAVGSGNFRSDLFHRLNEFPVKLPPLRERKEDIPFLANRFLDEAKAEFNKDVHSFSPEAMRTLLDHHWPGNVRELRNAVRRAVLLSDSMVVAEVYPTLAEPGPGMNHQLSEKLDVLAQLRKGYSLHEIAQKEIDGFEKAIIAQTLSITGGNKVKAAKMLKIDRMTLYSKLRKYQIE